MFSQIELTVATTDADYQCVFELTVFPQLPSLRQWRNFCAWPLRFFSTLLLRLQTMKWGERATVESHGKSLCLVTINKLETSKISMLKYKHDRWLGLTSTAVYTCIHTELLGLATLRLSFFSQSNNARPTAGKLAGFADSVLFSTTLAAQTKVSKEKNPKKSIDWNQ